MKVRDLMSSPAHVCNAGDSLENAARVLWEHDVGVLPVVDEDGRVRATITDRDICMAAWTQGACLRDIRVSSSMSQQAVTCRADEDVSAASQRMAQSAVRRLPVVDESGKVVGVLSLGDLARAAAKDRAAGTEALKALVAICQPRPTGADGSDGKSARQGRDGQDGRARDGGDAASQERRNLPLATSITAKNIGGDRTAQRSAGA